MLKLNWDGEGQGWKVRAQKEPETYLKAEKKAHLGVPTFTHQCVSVGGKAADEPNLMGELLIEKFNGSLPKGSVDNGRNPLGWPVFKRVGRSWSMGLI